MGDPCITEVPLIGERRPPIKPNTHGLTFDSVFAKEGVTDNGGGPGSQFHDEYVLFDGAQVYPEYAIFYTL